MGSGVPKVDGDATCSGSTPLVCPACSLSCMGSARVVQLECRLQSWVPDSVYSAGGGRSSVEAWYTAALDIEEVLAGAVDSHVHVFVADVIKSFDKVDRGDFGSGSQSSWLACLVAWFRHADFEYHAHVRLRFKLASGIVAFLKVVF